MPVYRKQFQQLSSKKFYVTNPKHNHRILYVAYHYPPILGSSGVHRTLAFTRYLSQRGWNVSVLTTRLKAYIQWDASQQELIPEQINVVRAFAWDTARHLSFKGKYLDWMAIPDRWQSWIPFAIWSGWRAIRKQKCQVIVSTYPIASAHIIAYFLHRITGLPWVADLRDPMAQENYPKDQRVKRVFHWIESKIVKHCASIIVTAPGAIALYKNRFPHLPDSIWQILPNGYDGELLDAFLTEPVKSEAKEKIRILHSGVVYPSERDPSHLFQALQALKKAEPDIYAKLDICFRATGSDDYFTTLINEYALADVVHLAPRLPFKEAIKDMQQADVLLLLQASNCNYQIPAKAYEYIRVGKPILALTDPEGDTGAVMASSKVAVISNLDDAKSIQAAIIELVERLQTNDFDYLDEEQVKTFSRNSQAEQLDRLLTSIVEQD